MNDFVKHNLVELLRFLLELIRRFFGKPANEEWQK